MSETERDMGDQLTAGCEEPFDELMATGYGGAVRSARITAHALRALLTLAAADVPVVVLKGVALAHTLYPSFAQRPMGDADLLVRHRDRERAIAALGADGFRVDANTSRRFGLAATACVIEMSCRRTEEDPLIELHWNLTASRVLLRSSAIDVDALFRDAQPLDLGGVRGKQLSPYDTLLHLCLHLTAHGYSHPVGYTDIARLLDRVNPFPWDAFLARVRGARLRTVCYFPLEVCAASGAPIPGSILEALRPASWQRGLVRRIADPGPIARGEVVHPPERSFLLHLAVADRPLAMLGVALWFLFPGPRYLAERYRLAAGSSPYLACLWHPLVVMWRATVNLVRLAWARQ